MAIAIASAPGCAAKADGSQSSAAALESSTTQATPLTAKVKAAYEASVKSGSAFWLAGEKSFPGEQLVGAAREDFAADAETSKGYGYGYPEVRVATVDGHTIYAMSGIVSDTGDILGFYDETGTELCEAYSGQGAQPNENGVDWWK